MAHPASASVHSGPQVHRLTSLQAVGSSPTRPTFCMCSSASCLTFGSGSCLPEFRLVVDARAFGDGHIWVLRNDVGEGAGRLGPARSTARGRPALLWARVDHLFGILAMPGRWSGPGFPGRGPGWCNRARSGSGPSRDRMGPANPAQGLCRHGLDLHAPVAPGRADGATHFGRRKPRVSCCPVLSRTAPPVQYRIFDRRLSVTAPAITYAAWVPTLVAIIDRGHFHGGGCGRAAGTS